MQPGVDPAGGVRIAFNVPDLDAFHDTMRERAVPCVGEPKVQFGTKLAQYADPDGQVFSVGEARKSA
jgi:predicted enzyme related to lactoylglutathione lyase